MFVILLVVFHFVMLDEVYFASWSPHGGVFKADLDDVKYGTPAVPKSLVNEDNFPGISNQGVLGVEVLPDVGFFFTAGGTSLYFSGFGDASANFTLVYEGSTISVVKALPTGKGTRIFFVTDDEGEKTLRMVDGKNVNNTYVITSWKESDYDLEWFEIKDLIVSPDSSLYIVTSTFVYYIQTRIYQVYAPTEQYHLKELFRKNGTAGYQAVLSPDAKKLIVGDFYPYQNGVWTVDFPAMTNLETMLKTDDHNIGYTIDRNDESLFYAPASWTRKCAVYRTDIFGESCVVSNDGVSDGSNLLTVRIV